MPPPPLPPPHLPKRRKVSSTALSAIGLALIAAVFYFILWVAGVKPEGAVPATVTLWVGLMTLAYTVLRER